MIKLGNKVIGWLKGFNNRGELSGTQKAWKSHCWLNVGLKGDKGRNNG